DRATGGARPRRAELRGTGGRTGVTHPTHGVGRDRDRGGHRPVRAGRRRARQGRRAPRPRARPHREAGPTPHRTQTVLVTLAPTMTAPALREAAGGQASSKTEPRAAASRWRKATATSSRSSAWSTVFWPMRSGWALRNDFTSAATEGSDST